MAENVAAILARAEAGDFDNVADSGSSDSDAGDVGQESGQGNAGLEPRGNAATQSGDERPRQPDGKFGKQATPPPAVGGQGKAPVVQTKGQVPAKGVIDPGDPATWQPEHNIPYPRFKDVITARDKFKADVARLQAENEQLRTWRNFQSQQNPPAQQTARSDSKVIDDIWGDGGGEKKPLGFADLPADVQRDLQTMREERAQRHIQGKIDDVRSRYPDVDEDLLWHAATGGPQVDLEAAAERWQERINGWMKMGLSKSQATQQASTGAQAPVAARGARQSPPPRPPLAGSAGTAAKSSKDGVNMADTDQRLAWQIKRARELGAQ